jgi:exodeoxyribonuclease VII large subunit
MVHDKSNISGVERRIYTVSELTALLKMTIEDNFPFVWISGEISNFRIPSSGHFYFTLKDENAQISAVMFRGQSRNLNLDLEDGIKIIGLGRISVYEPRGTYQIILEYVEPMGIGALQIAFEKLKKRLFDEGLFEEKHKKPLPLLPKKITIITSPTGAVVHDIIDIVNRRFPNIKIEIVPVKVQGEGSVNEIVEAFALLNELNNTDVIILARGGGSLEDLQAFNSEPVARAIFASNIPVVSAVGHEIDYTISDFVADLRAPTPSAAAELVVPVKKDLSDKINDLYGSLKTLLIRYVNYKRFILKSISERIIHPRKKIQDLRLRLDDFSNRLIGTVLRNLKQNRERLKWRDASLKNLSPLSITKKHKVKVEQLNTNIFIFINNIIKKDYSRLSELTASLNSINPIAILERGYSITRTIPHGKIVRDPDQVLIHQDLEVIVSKGVIICRVERKSGNV